MAEYTYKDIIVDPDDPRLKDAIEKEVYVNDDVHYLLEFARGDVRPAILKEVVTDCRSGIFLVEDKEFGTCHYVNAIIIKKIDPPKYIPFTTGYEFILKYDECRDIRNIDADDTIADIICLDNGCGMRVKSSNDYLMVTRISENGIEVNGKFVNWEELFKNYTFIYDELCGKVNEVSNG